jgi:hypothetical protein
MIKKGTHRITRKFSLLHIISCKNCILHHLPQKKVWSSKGPLTSIST